MVYLSSIRPVDPAWQILPGTDVGEMHKQVWEFFPGLDRGQRPFLFRMARGQVYVQSSVPPVAPEGWKMDMRRIEHYLEEGLQFQFMLLVYPTVTIEGRRRGVVSHQRYLLKQKFGNDLSSMPSGADIMMTALSTWMERQGQKRGFKLESLNITAAMDMSFENSKQHLIGFQAYDLLGVLTVTDPEVFRTKAIIGGLGKGKAFGFGMLMLRRI